MAAQAPLSFKLTAGCEIQLAFVFAQRFSVQTALGADAAIAGEDLIAQVAGVGAQLPFVHAGGATEGKTAARDRHAAPAAQAALALDPTPGLDSAGAHTRSSYPSWRMPSMIRARISPASSEESVRSGAPRVRRKVTLLRPSSSGAPVY